MDTTKSQGVAAAAFYDTIKYYPPSDWLDPWYRTIIEMDDVDLSRFCAEMLDHVSDEESEASRHGEYLFRAFALIGIAVAYGQEVLLRPYG